MQAGMISQEEAKASLAQINAGKEQIKTARSKINAGKKQISRAKTKIAKAETTLDQKSSQLKKAKQTIKTNEAKLVSARKQITSGEKKIAKAESKLSSGEKKLKRSRKKAEKKFKEAEQKIADARQDVKDIKKGKWYVLNREKMQSYVEYGQEADRIAALGRVVPVIFFLVAALVSLTAMTRMVEEQRTQIGMMKALGYSGVHIAMKYVTYALAATLSGSILGAVIGEKLLPWIIINAYKMMYTGLGDVYTPLEIEYSVIAGGLAVGVVVLAVLSACYKELREKPAQLMRTPETIFRNAYYYLLVTFIGVPCTFFYNLLSSIIRALGDSKTPFWFLLFSTVLNVLLDLFCILVLDWGVTGAAIATVISQGVSAGLCYFYMMRKFEILKTTVAERKFQTSLARTLLYIGVPMGLQFSITAIGSIMLQSANNALGTACVAAFTAAMRIKMFCMCPLESLGIAMATYSGQNYGAGKPERIWAGIKASGWMMLVYCAFVFVVLLLGAKTFALLFVEASELEILKDTELFLHISVIFFPVLGLLCILRYTIQGAGYTNLAMLSGVSEMIARTLVSLFAVPAWGYFAVCFGDPTAWVFADLFLIPAFIYVYGRIKRIVPPSVGVATVA